MDIKDLDNIPHHYDSLNKATDDGVGEAAYLCICQHTGKENGNFVNLS